MARDGCSVSNALKRNRTLRRPTGEYEMNKKAVETPRYAKEAYLRERRWIFNPSKGPWSWREPRLRTWHTLEDAWEVERTLVELERLRARK